MRTHYVPQHYLRGFARHGERELIWVFEKDTGRKFATQPKSVAAEQDYYPAEVEEFLATLIEEPSNRILRLIREEFRFSTRDKNEFSRYILAMIRRVPRHRERLYNDVHPDALDNTFSSWRTKIQSLYESDVISRATYSRRMQEIESIEARWRIELPDELKPENQPPQINPDVANFIASMHWTFVITKGPSMFLASDNPVFYTEGIGMNKPHSELLFPLASQVALWVKRLPVSDDCTFCYARQLLVRELNKRTALNATRYVYYHKDAEWIGKILAKRKLKLQHASSRDHGLFGCR